MLHKRQCQLREEIWAGAEEEAGWSRPVWQCPCWCACIGQAMGTRAAAGTCCVDVPHTGAHHRGHEGIEWKGEAGGQRMHRITKSQNGRGWKGPPWVI